MTDVERQQQIQAAEIVRALLNEFGAITEYHILRDSLPRRLAALLRCHCVVFYQRMGETLQLVAGSFDDEPGWSASLLAVAHINPLHVSGNGPEACAWRERRVVMQPEEHATLIALPLMYRHRGIGVMVALRGQVTGRRNYAQTWDADEVQSLDVIADIVTLLLENTRLLERDRARIHELSLLNSMSNQMNYALYDHQRLTSIIIQRTKEISLVNLCALLEPVQTATTPAWVTPAFHELLLNHFREHSVPLMIERPGDGNDPRITHYLQQLPVEVKTFFAFPLVSSQETTKHTWNRDAAQDVVPQVLGIIVGAYHHVWKLRREEIVLLQVLSNQASAVLKNIQLMAEVVEARNEARKLLRQVLDDQRLQELILASIPSGLITTDLNGSIITFNRAAEAILGYHPSEVLGQSLQKFLHLRTTSFLHPTAQKLESVGITEYEGRERVRQVRSETVVMLDRHKQEVILDVDVVPLWRDPGEQMGMLITFVDMTAVHRLEEEKRRLDRLAALGEMAANVAHEVRNPLASIKTAMQMLADEFVSNQQGLQPAYSSPTADQAFLPYVEVPGERSVVNSMQEGALESIDIVLKEVERLDTIVRELLQFARPRQLHRSCCNIGELSNHVLQLLQRQCGEAGVVVQRVYALVPSLQVDIVQMEQVLLNLFMNAIQAMPDGGILTVSCDLLPEEQALREARVTEAAPLCLFTGNTPGTDRCVQAKSDKGQQWLELTVSDTGPGIAADQTERIFQPFFTTRAHGIGLGLAITRRLIQDHGGYIHVAGNFGYGATISVRLPLLPEPDGVDKEGAMSV